MNQGARPDWAQAAAGILGWLLPAMKLASACLIFLMMMITFIDVIGRYVFTAPIFGAAEMIQFLLALSIFAGLGLVNAHDDHISVELFDPVLDRWMPRLRPILIQLFSVIAMVIIAYELTKFAIEAQQNNRITVVLEWPLSFVAYAIAGLSVLSLLAQILGLMTGLAGSKHTIDPGPGAA